MIAVYIATVSAITVIVLWSWTLDAYREFLAKTSPHPINLEAFEDLQARFDDLDRRAQRTETKLNAQGMR